MYGEWPFERIQASEHAHAVLRRLWTQLSQRRPFKHDFPNMYEKEPDEFDQMFSDIANAVDSKAER